MTPVLPGDPLMPAQMVAVQEILSTQTLDLTKRSPYLLVNEGFSDNILLSLHYLNGEEFSANKVDWLKIREPFRVSFTLGSNQVFAFHDLVLPQYKDPVVTMKSNFTMKEGYKFVAGLPGSGVCHLATLMNWVAREAGLEVLALANHDFAPVKGVERQYGTSIKSNSATQNLYLKNTKNYPVIFEFLGDSEKVVFSVLK